MKKRHLRPLSLLLSLVMVLTMLPYTAFEAEAAETNTATGNLAVSSSETVTTTTYELASSIDTSGEYLIASGNNGTVTILGHNDTKATTATGTVSNNKLTVTTNNFSDTNYLWKFSKSISANASNAGTVSNDSIYIYLQDGTTFSKTSNNVSIVLTGSSVAISYTVKSNNKGNQGPGSEPDYGTRNYLTAEGKIATSNTNLYLYKKTSSTTTTTTYSQGDSVSFTVTPESATLNAYNNETTTLTPSVTVGSAEATSSDITWTSSDTSVATVDDKGNVTSVGKGSATITATLNKVNDSAIYESSTETTTLSVTIPITVNYEEKLEEATEYPEYPNDGAVRIDKNAEGTDFETTGVANVELDAAGISVKTGVDVVLVVDVSNSMGWSIENAGGSSDSAKRPTGNQTTKLQNAMTAASNFADILLSDNTGATSDNTLSFVTFAGYDKENGASQDNVDSVMTVFTGVKDEAKAKKSFAGTSFSGTGTTYTLKITDENGNVLVNGSNRGDTNYDYAFWQAEQCVDSIQSHYTDYSKSGRETIVLFMTDGAASHYNNYKAKSSRVDYKPGTTTAYPYYTGSDNITQDQWIKYMKETDNTYATSLYKKLSGFYAVGFDLAHGGFSTFTWGESDLTAVLSGMVTDATIPVMTASDATTLNALYESLANQIKLAGTKAQVTDTIDSAFTLQMASSSGIDADGKATSVPSDITVKTYDLYTKADTSDATKIGTRKGTSTTLETVTFNEAGTEAYSDKIGGSKTNIMTKADDGSVKIEAYYFTYTKDADGVEKFVWKIGDITDKEIALSYYVYLKGALEGTAKKGIYETNENAVLDYVDINGKQAHKTFPVPALVWGGASTAYEFYLVNEDGQPVNHNGDVIPFANRVIVSGPTYMTLNLNQSESVSATVYAQSVLPEGFVLLDETSAYTVTTAGGSLKGTLTTTGKATEKVSFDENNYTQSRVAFGVLWNKTPTYADPELSAREVVVDYGKAIETDFSTDGTMEVKSNETIYTRKGIAGFAAYNAKANLKEIHSKPTVTEFKTDNGIFTIDGKNVKYQMTKMLSSVDKVFCVVEYASADEKDSIYMYQELDIIPATIMYYETNFSDEITTSDEMTQMADDGTTTDEPVSADGTQDDGTVGKNTYGYDSTYLNDSKLSDGSSYYINNTSDAIKKNVAAFTFTGTGFDLISRTGANQGLIKATIYESDKTTKVKTVTVLNKSDSNLELYQVPVISVNDLDHGSYYVTIQVYSSYTDAEDSELSRGGEFYFDALRVYDPIDVSAGKDCTGDAKTAYEAYLADGESTYTLTEIRGALLSAESATEVLETTDGDGKTVPGVLYVDKNSDGVSVEDYASIGPNNEVYLTGNETIAFSLDLSKKIPASIDLGAKSADGNKTNLKVSVYTDPDAEPVVQFTKEVTGSTVEFYDLFDGKTVKDKLGSSESIYIKVDANNTGILSITDLKVGYGKADDADAGDAPAVASLLASPKLMTAIMNTKTVAPEKTENYDVTSASFASSKVVQNKYATMTVVTGADAEKLTVVNKAGEAQKIKATSVDNGDGTKTWTVKFKAAGTGTQKYTVTAYNKAGEAGASVTAQIKVVYYDVISASFTKTKVVKNKKAVLKVVTGADAKKLKVVNKAGKAQKITVSSVKTSGGKKIWKVKLKVTGSGTQKYKVTAYDATGKSGKSATVKIKVTLR